MQSAIVTKQLSKKYKDLNSPKKPLEVFRNLNLNIKKESFTVLFGSNGCGKSTLIHVLAGLIDYDSGTISIFGKDLNKTRIGLVFQNYSASLLPWLTVLDNICFGLKDHKISKIQKMEIVTNLLKDLGLNDLKQLLNVYPYKLSGGQQQMVAIARALFLEPSIIFLDEAFSSLSEKNRDIIFVHLQKYCIKRKITCLCATHNLDEAILMADNLYILKANPRFIKEKIKIEFDRPRETNLRKSPKFLDVRKSVLNMLFEAGAEVRSVGRVKWIHADTGEKWKNPSNCALFILKGKELKNAKS